MHIDETKKFKKKKTQKELKIMIMHIFIYHIFIYNGNQSFHQYCAFIAIDIFVIIIA